MPEFEFLVRGTQMLKKLQEKGCPLCIPEIRPMEERAFSATGLYNPCVALKIEDDIVANDVIFDENAAIYVLTGPNRGGKSVITCAIGIAQAMLQLGMFVPAKKATISIADAIYTHFPTGADDTIDKGRLGEECARLVEIFESITKHSLVLLDESLSSTGSYEASYIASEILSGFAVRRARGIFSTHLHELAARVPEINERSREYGGVMMDTLVAGIEEGKRSFKIHRAKPDGKSYARDIANKYGLSFDELIGAGGKDQ
jgi:DNA mismatch repair ATPase MutS